MKTFVLSLLSLAGGFAVSQILPAAVAPASALKAPTAVVILTENPLPLSGSTMSHPPSELPDWQSAATAWAEADPAGFYDWLIKRGIPPGERVLKILFTAWASRDADAAFTALFQLPSDFQRQDYLMDAVMRVILSKPGGLRLAMKWLPQVDEQGFRMNWVEPPWESYGTPEQTGALLAEKASGKGFSTLMLQFFGAWWAKQDPAAALSWMRSIPPQLWPGTFSGILDALTNQDPQAALNYLATETATTAERIRAGWALQALAKSEPEAAVAWWENHVGVVDQTGLRWIFSAWCREDSTAAGKYALTIEDPMLRRKALDAWGVTAENKGVREAILAIPEGPERSTLIVALSNALDPSPEDGEFLRRLVEEGGSDITPRTVGSVAGHFAETEPAAALRWAGTLQENLQPAAIGAVIKSWKDGVASAEAVDRLPEGSFKTTARQVLGEK